MHTYVYVWVGGRKEAAFSGGLFWCWPITFIEWQHLLQVGWRSVRIGMACTGRAIIRIEVDIYRLDDKPR